VNPFSGGRQKKGSLFEGGSENKYMCNSSTAQCMLLLEHAIVRRVRVVPSGAAPREDRRRNLPPEYTTAPFMALPFDISFRRDSMIVFIPESTTSSDEVGSVMNSRTENPARSNLTSLGFAVGMPKFSSLMSS
jgi:hypothetical protein